MGKALSDMTLEELWALFPIFLVPHNENWAMDYAEMEERLRKGMKEIRIERISHIGSTAVKGIWAKNIIDILLEIMPEEEMHCAVQAAAALGFRRMSETEERASLNWGYTPEGFADKVYHLHIRFVGDHDELYFRDYLNENPEAAKEYERLKLALWRQYEHDRDGYTNAKHGLVARYTQEAKARYHQRY